MNTKVHSEKFVPDISVHNKSHMDGLGSNLDLCDDNPATTSAMAQL